MITDDRSKHFQGADARVVVNPRTDNIAVNPLSRADAASQFPEEDMIDTAQMVVRLSSRGLEYLKSRSFFAVFSLADPEHSDGRDRRCIAALCVP